MPKSIVSLPMPKSCDTCRFFGFRGIACTGPSYYMDARCALLPEDGIIGEDISHIPGYGAYKYETHCVPAHTRAKECPFIEETE